MGRGSRSKDNGLPMGRMAISVGPSLLAGQKGISLSQAFAGDQVFKGRQPVLVIMGTVVGLATIFCSLQFSR